MPQVVAGLYHEHCEALAVQSQVVDARRQQRATAAISAVHAGSVVDKQRGDLATAMYGHVQLQCCDARCVDVVDAGAVSNEH